MKLTIHIPEEEIVYTLEVEMDDTDPYGNAMASGDDDFDRKVANQIIEELNRGNVWAWCGVTVTASWKGWQGKDSLWGCSCDSEEDFTQNNSDYYESIKDEARHNLLENVADDINTLLFSVTSVEVK